LGAKQALADQPKVAFPPPLHDAAAHPFKSLTIA
jgi:hypothetical protein